jgi:hypothetical protein
MFVEILVKVKMNVQRRRLVEMELGVKTKKKAQLGGYA